MRARACAEVWRFFSGALALSGPGRLSGANRCSESGKANVGTGDSTYAATRIGLALTRINMYAPAHACQLIKQFLFHDYTILLSCLSTLVEIRLRPKRKPS